MTSAELIRLHIPSITEQIENEEYGVAREQDPEAFDLDGDYIGPMRECRCGVIVEGYYEYTDHLIDVFEKAGL